MYDPFELHPRITRHSFVVRDDIDNDPAERESKRQLARDLLGKPESEMTDADRLMVALAPDCVSTL